MIRHDAVDGSEAASDFEGIEQIILATDRNFDAIRSDRTYDGAQRKSGSAMTNKIQKAFGVKSPEEDERCGLHHNA